MMLVTLGTDDVTYSYRLSRLPQKPMPAPMPSPTQSLSIENN